jgi:hypothetical protein
MPKKGETDLDKRRYWLQVLADFEKSGLSGQAYCRATGIPYTSFANRRRRSDWRRTPKSGRHSEKTRFVPFAEVKVSDDPPSQSLDPVQENGPATLEIVLPTGIIIRVGNPSLLSTVIQLLDPR